MGLGLPSLFTGLKTSLSFLFLRHDIKHFGKGGVGVRSRQITSIRRVQFSLIVGKRLVISPYWQWRAAAAAAYRVVVYLNLFFFLVLLYLKKYLFAIYPNIAQRLLIAPTSACYAFLESSFF